MERKHRFIAWQSLVVAFFFFCSLVVSAQDIGSADEEPADQELPVNMASTVKGNVFVSTTFSGEHSERENETRLLQNLDDSYRLNWNVTASSGYFIRDNFAIGGYFKYSNQLDRQTDTNDAGEVFDESLERFYSIAPFIRNYLPLGKGSFALPYISAFSWRTVTEPKSNSLTGRQDQSSTNLKPPVTMNALKPEFRS